MHRTELEALENRLSQLKDISTEESRIQQANRRIAEINSLRMNSASLHSERKAELISAIMDIVSQCAVHREHVQSTLKSVKAEYTSRLESLLADQQILNEAAASTATVLSSHTATATSNRSSSSSVSTAKQSGSSSGNTPSNKSPMSLRSSVRKSAPASAAKTPVQQQEPVGPPSSSYSAKKHSGSSGDRAKGTPAQHANTENENANENENTENDSSPNGLTFPRTQLLSKFNQDEQQLLSATEHGRASTGSGKKPASSRAAAASSNNHNTEADYSTSHYYSPNVSQYA